MANNSDSNINDALVLEVEELREESSGTNSQLNEIRDQLAKIQDRSTEADIEEQQSADDQLELFTESLAESNDLLTSIDSRLELNSYLSVGEFFFIGILTGVVLFRILFDRLKV
jgi:uncharacterized membrane protein YdfJ with MMPL/SSD domain